MNQPNNPNRDDEHELYGRLAREPGPRPDDQPPIYGEAHPIGPQRMVSLPLPLRPAVAVWVLLAINVVVFVIPALLSMLGLGVRVNAGLLPLLGASFRVDPGMLVRFDDLIQLLGQKDNLAIAQAGQYYRFLTAMFLHANLLHIAFNVFALFSLGIEAERIYGTARFLALYFIAGLAGGLASYAFSPAPSVGASGAIFGLIGGLAAFYYVARGVLGQTARQQLGSLLTVVMINLALGFSAPNIDNFAHLGGLFGGALAGWLLAPRFELDRYIFPPAVRRASMPLAWPGALALLVLLAGLAMIITPPTF